MNAMKMAIVLVMLVPAAQAVAWERGGGACQADVAKFCKDVQPGGGRIIQCLKSHNAELSAGCSAQVAHKEGEMHEAMADCKPDADKFCAGVKPGEGRIAECLRSHEAELAPTCKAHFGQRHGHGPAPAPGK